MDADDVAAELYGLAPGEFTAERDARARAARAAGDRALAGAVLKLRKPTTAAWAVNLLARHRLAELRRLVDVGDALRRAQTALRGDEVRRLSAQRHDVVAALARQAGDLARAAGHPVSDAVIDDVEETLQAALARPEAATAVLAGRLTAPLVRQDMSTDPPEVRSAGRASHGQTDTGRRAAEAAARAQAELDESRRAAERAEAEVASLARQVAEAEEALHELQERRRRADTQLAEARRRERSAERASDEARARL